MAWGLSRDIGRQIFGYEDGPRSGAVEQPLALQALVDSGGVLDIHDSGRLGQILALVRLAADRSVRDCRSCCRRGWIGSCVGRGGCCVRC